MQPASSSPKELCFNENAAQSDQHVEMTGCLWFGVKSFFLYFAFLLQQLKPSHCHCCLVKAFLQRLQKSCLHIVTAECETRL